MKKIWIIFFLLNQCVYAQDAFNDFSDTFHCLRMHHNDNECPQYINWKNISDGYSSEVLLGLINHRNPVIAAYALTDLIDKHNHFYHKLMEIVLYREDTFSSSMYGSQEQFTLPYFLYTQAYLNSQFIDIEDEILLLDSTILQADSIADIYVYSLVFDKDSFQPTFDERIRFQAYNQDNPYAQMYLDEKNILDAEGIINPETGSLYSMYVCGGVLYDEPKPYNRWVTLGVILSSFLLLGYCLKSRIQSR